MEFTIGQNTSLPLLKMQVVKNGTQDFDFMMKFIETSSVFFSMVNTENGISKILTKSAGFVEKLEMDPNASAEFYIYYKFTSQDTSKIGRYEGQFVFINETGTLVLPIRENLYINVVESFNSIDITYNPCYTLEYSCCTTPFPTPTPTPTNEPEISVTPTMTVTPTPTLTPTPTQTPNQPICMHHFYNQLVYSTTNFGDFRNNTILACLALNGLEQGTDSVNGYYDRYTNSQQLTVGDLLYSNDKTCFSTGDTGYFIMWQGGSYNVYLILNGVMQDSTYIC